MIIFSFFYSFIIIFGVLSKITLAVKLQQCDIKSSGDGAPVACTESGAVKGYKGDNNIAIFKGIPYASAQRWKEPQPAPKWKGIKITTDFGSSCAQPSNNNGFTGSEDSISSIGKTDKLSPVYIWIHGGAFTIGSAASGPWSGEGGMSIYYLAFSPLTTDLMKAVTIESAGAFYPNDPKLCWVNPSSIQDAEKNGIAHLSFLGKDATASQLRALSTEKIFQNKWSGFFFQPVQDGYVIPGPIKQLMEQKKQNQFYMLIEYGSSPTKKVSLVNYKQDAISQYGSLANDYLQLYPASDDSSATSLANTAPREYFTISQNMWGQLWIKGCSKGLYQYLYDHAPPGTEKTTGCNHGSELPYFLNTISKNASPSERALADKMSNYIVNFIKKYDPNGDNLEKWSSQSVGSKTVMGLGNKFGDKSIASGQTDKKIEFVKRFMSSRGVL
uniref:Carboxylesterase type B domain-containing protein n=1 Tax=Meloidogyne floridensis TaxID=298350 RepID=A0A915NDP1_9BILA